jgi:hypothetical protein
MILFQPCPYHYPELLKADFLDSLKLLKTRGFTDAEEILRERPDFFSWNMHGFLIDDGRLVERGYVIANQDDIYRLRGEGIDIPDECLIRARTFHLKAHSIRLEWAASMGRAHDRRTRCLPRARETWPPIK